MPARTLMLRKLSGFGARAEVKGYEQREQLKNRVSRRTFHYLVVSLSEFPGTRNIDEMLDDLNMFKLRCSWFYANCFQDVVKTI